MEARSAWTDERLNDRFDHIDSELGMLRVEMRQGFAEVRDSDGLQAGRMDPLGSELRSEISLLRSTMVRLSVSTHVTLLGVLAAVLLRGA